METKKRDKRKILLVLPLLVMPFLALGFYAAGGGKGTSGNEVLASKGINTSLPDANFKTEDPSDKMGFYAKGDRDTSALGGVAKLAERMGFNGSVEDEKTAEINAKLAALNKEINAPAVTGPVAGGSASRQAPTGKNEMKGDVDRLEMLMKSMKADKEKDPEMEQMNAMLEKIMDIQNPARAQQKVVGKIYGDLAEKEFLAVPAELADRGKVVQGSTIRLRLLDSVVLKNVVVPKGHFLFGLCRLVNQRLLLDIKSIRVGSLILPVELTMYGLDGMPGLQAKDAVFGDVASGGAVDAVGGISVYGMDGVAGQVAGAGIDAAKSFFSRKVRVVRVKLKAGEKVLLRNNRP